MADRPAAAGGLRAVLGAMGLGTRILLGMVVGAFLGAVLGERVLFIEPLGDLFVRLLILAAVPLVFFNLLAGLTTLTDLKTLGRLAGKILGFFFVTTIVALLFGVAAMAILRPGVGMTLQGVVEEEVGVAPSVIQILMDLVPENLVQAFAVGDVAQVVVVAVFIGIATLLLPEAPRGRLRKAFADLADLFRKFVDLILLVAPYGIGALMAVTIGRYGSELFGPMARFIAGVTAAHLVMILLYMVLLRLFTTRRPWDFLRETWSVWATTISTTSSLASLSVGLDVAEQMRLPRSIYAFTLPLGAQINKDGTAAMLSAVVIFTMQAAGVPMTAGDLFTVVLMGFLLSAGSGGIPGGGFVVALIMVEAFSLPLELAVIVGGIYRLIDMGNTTANIMGDMVGTVILADRERVGRTDQAHSTNGSVPGESRTAETARSHEP
jgi:Na+/H+-dicarboxylate symporter